MQNKRLYPPSYGNLYYSMTKLRQAIEKALGRTKENLKIQQPFLLDAGCGTKPYKEITDKFGFNYLGADIALNHETDVKITDDGRFDCADNYVDIVLSTQVLEHVYDFDLYLSECYRVTKPGGYMIISTHGHWRYHPDPNDYWRWTSDGLKKTIERNKWRIEHFEGIMSITALSWQYLQDYSSYKLRLKILSAPYIWFFQKLVALADKVSTQQARDKDASVFLVIACKPL